MLSLGLVKQQHWAVLAVAMVLAKGWEKEASTGVGAGCECWPRGRADQRRSMSARC